MYTIQICYILRYIYNANPGVGEGLSPRAACKLLFVCVCVCVFLSLCIQHKTRIYSYSLRHPSFIVNVMDNKSTVGVIGVIDNRS